MSDAARRRAVFGTSAWTLVQLAALHVGAIATTIALTRGLSALQYGVIPWLNAYVLFFVIVIGLGVPNAAARYIAAETDRPGQRFVIAQSLRAILPWAAFSSLALVVMFPALVRALGAPELEPYRLIFLWLLLLELFRVFVEKICHGTATMRITAKHATIGSVLVLSLTLIALRLDATATAALSARGIALTAAGALILWPICRTLGTSDVHDGKLAPRKREIVGYGLPLAAITLAGFGFVQADIVMIGLFGDPVMVGIFAIGIFIYLRLMAVSRAIGFGIGPLFVDDATSSSERRDFVLAGLKYALLAAIPIAVLAVINGRDVTGFVFGRDYAEAGDVMAALSVFFLLGSALAVVGPAIDFMGKARVRAAAAVAGAVVNIALNVLLIPRYGVLGAAVATNLGYLVFSLIVFYSIRELVRGALTTWGPIGRLIYLISPVTVAALMFSRTVAGDASLLVNTALLAVLYPTLVLLLGVVGRDEVSALRDMYGKTADTSNVP